MLAEQIVAAAALWCIEKVYAMWHVPYCNKTHHLPLGTKSVLNSAAPVKTAGTRCTGPILTYTLPVFSSVTTRTDREYDITINIRH